MAKVDFSDSEEEKNLSGWRDVEVVGADELYSKGGDPMFKVLLAVGGTDFTVYDWIMLGGKAARWHSKKLKCLMGREIRDGEEIEAFDLIGKKAQAFFTRKPGTARSGKPTFYLSVDAKAPRSECGYLPEGVDPNEKIEPPEGGFEDIPF